MNKQINKKRRRARKLEALLLEGVNSGSPTPLTHADFEAIRQRGTERLEIKLNKKQR